jgi:hypothetical protein
MKRYPFAANDNRAGGLDLLYVGLASPEPVSLWRVVYDHMPDLDEVWGLLQMTPGETGAHDLLLERFDPLGAPIADLLVSPRLVEAITQRPLAALLRRAQPLETAPQLASEIRA